MTDDLDTLRPEVREAMSFMDRGAHGNTDEWQTIRAELLRLAAKEHAWQRWIADAPVAQVFEGMSGAGLLTATGGLPREWIDHRVALVKVEE